MLRAFAIHVRPFDCLVFRALLASMLLGSLAASAVWPALEELSRTEIRSLAEALASPDPEQRRAATKHLRVANLYEEFDTAFPALCGAASDTDGEVRVGAISTLRHLFLTATEAGLDPNAFQPSVPALIGALSRDRQTREAAVQMLAFVSPVARTREVAQAVLGVLDDSSASVRTYAVLILGTVGPVVPEVTPGLVRALRTDPEAHIRSLAAKALGGIGSPDPIAIAALVACLGETDPAVRRSALSALATVAPSFPSVVQRLVEVAANKGDDPAARRQALSSLGAVTVVTRRGIESLTRILEDGNEDGELRGLAAGALRNTGAFEALVLPALLVALHDADERIRHPAAAALIRIGPLKPEVLPALLDAVRGGNNIAIQELGKFGAKAPGIVPALITALQAQDATARGNAIQALGSIGPEAQEAVSALSQLANRDPDEWIRRLAEEALRRIGAR